MKKSNHPNCPNCTKLKDILVCCWKVGAQFEVIKLYRLYGREKAYKPIGWYCKKCGFILLEKKELNKPYNLLQQEIIVCNKKLEMEIKNKKKKKRDFNG